jgi:hypothetical protein
MMQVSRIKTDDPGEPGREGSEWILAEARKSGGKYRQNFQEPTRIRIIGGLVEPDSSLCSLNQVNQVGGKGTPKFQLIGCVTKCHSMAQANNSLPRRSRLG